MKHTHHPIHLILQQQDTKKSTWPNYKRITMLNFANQAKVYVRRNQESSILHVSFCYMSPLACHSALSFQGVLLFEPFTETDSATRSVLVSSRQEAGRQGG